MRNVSQRERNVRQNKKKLGDAHFASQNEQTLPTVVMILKPYALWSLVGQVIIRETHSSR